MKIIKALFKHPTHLLSVAGILCSVFSSCNSAIYDDEGDCDYTYRVAFRYDKNMKWSDAFAAEVKSVNLYAFDRNGILVWQNAEKGSALAADGYAMTLDVPPGDYHLLAWCGLDNDGERAESFTVPQAQIGRTTLGELQCRLEREYDSAGACSRQNLYALFHGAIDVSLPDLSNEGGTYTSTILLTKDTNHVRIILQHMSGEPVNPADFTFIIEEENGLMAHNNLLLDDEMITYHSYLTRSGTASMELDDYPVLGKSDQTTQPSSPTQTSISVAIADLSIPRLMYGRKTYLTVRKNGEEKAAARVPLTDYAIMLKPYDDMDNQDFLDRQDEWALTFFLNENDQWIATSVIINSWCVVLNDINFGGENQEEDK